MMNKANTFLAVLLGMLIGFNEAKADSTNSFPINKESMLTFQLGNEIDLSEGGAIEFWVKHQMDAEKSNAWFENVSRHKNLIQTGDGYSVVLAVGTSSDLSFAVVVGPGHNESSQASIGIVSNLDDIVDPGKWEASSTNLYAFLEGSTKETRPLLMSKDVYYHVVLAKERGGDLVNVFVNGMKQTPISNASFGKTVNKLLQIGWPSEKRVMGEGEEQVSYQYPNPFTGSVGGLRIWKSGDKWEKRDAYRLMKFNRPVNRNLLAALPEYGNLLAYGDFTERRWDEKKGHIADAPPRLVIADPLAGAWVSEKSAVKQKIDEASGAIQFQDYPVFTFVPVKTDGGKRYDVLEDGQFIGSLVFDKRNGESENWTYKRSRETRPWPSIAFTHGPTQRHLDWVLAANLDLPTKRFLGGVNSGVLTLKRRTVVDLGIDSLSEKQFTPEEEAELKANDDLTTVFLYSAHPQFFDLLYSGYNISRMDSWNLFQTGTNRGKEARIFKVPTAQGTFQLDKSEQLIMPYDLGVLNQQVGKSSSNSRIVSNSSDYSSSVTSRLGLGISGSVSATANSGLQVGPVTTGGSISATLNLHVVVQNETAKDVSRQESTRTERIISTDYKQKYVLHHKPELMQLDEPFVDAIRTLHSTLQTLPVAKRRAVLNLFFIDWGTHYPFAASYGKLKISETKVTAKMQAMATSTSNKFEVSINDGKTGTTRTQKSEGKESEEVATTEVKEVGIDGSNNAPIAVDLRPIYELLTPQHFPDEPHIYKQLRDTLVKVLPQYRNEELIGTVLDATKDTKKAEAILESFGPPKANQALLKTRKLAMKYTGVSVDSPWTFYEKPPARNMLLSGTVKLVPYDYSDWKGFRPVSSAPNQMAEQVRALTKKYKAVTVASTSENSPADVTTDGSTRHMFGGSDSAIYTWEVPESPAADFFGIGIQAELTAPEFRYKGAKSTGKTDTGKTWILWSKYKKEAKASTSNHNVWREETRINGTVTIKETRTLKWPAVPPDGLMLWANNKPAAYSFARDKYLPFLDPISEMRFEKTGIYYGTEKRPYVFAKPNENDGSWRSGSAQVLIKMHKSVRPGLTPRVADNAIAHIHYEYCLLPSFRDSVAANGEALPAKSWGRVTTSSSKNSASLAPFQSRSYAGDMAAIMNYGWPKSFYKPTSTRSIDALVVAAAPEPNAHFPFSGNTKPLVGTKAAFVTQAGGDDLDKRALDISQLVKKKQHEVEVPELTQSSFTVHLDMERYPRFSGDVVGGFTTGSLIRRGDDFSIQRIVTSRGRSFILKTKDKVVYLGEPEAGDFDGTWGNFTISVDAKERKIRVQLNGRLQEFLLDSQTSIPATSTRWVLGGAGDGGPNSSSFARRIDNLMFFDKALTRGQMKALSLQPRLSKEDREAILGAGDQKRADAYAALNKAIKDLQSPLRDPGWEWFVRRSFYLTILSRMDKNKDGKVSSDEMPSNARAGFEAKFGKEFTFEMFKELTKANYPVEPKPENKAKVIAARLVQRKFELEGKLVTALEDITYIEDEKKSTVFNRPILDKEESARLFEALKAFEVPSGDSPGVTYENVLKQVAADDKDSPIKREGIDYLAVFEFLKPRLRAFDPPAELNQFIKAIETANKPIEDPGVFNYAKRRFENELLPKMDKNGDGKITPEEADDPDAFKKQYGDELTSIKYWAKQQDSSKETRVAYQRTLVEGKFKAVSVAVFKLLDTNSGGPEEASKLDAKESQNLLKLIAERNLVGSPGASTLQIFSLVDGDSDGQITVAELIAALKPKLKAFN